MPEIPGMPPEDQPEEERIKHDMSLEEAAGLLSDGNPGAGEVLGELTRIDPLVVLDIDHAHLYGDDLYDVYRNVCNSDYKKFQDYLAARRNLNNSVENFGSDETD